MWPLFLLLLFNFILSPSTLPYWFVTYYSDFEFEHFGVVQDNDWSLDCKNTQIILLEAMLWQVCMKGEVPHSKKKVVQRPVTLGSQLWGSRARKTLKPLWENRKEVGFLHIYVMVQGQPLAKGFWGIETTRSFVSVVTYQLGAHTGWSFIECMKKVISTWLKIIWAIFNIIRCINVWAWCQQTFLIDQGFCELGNTTQSH